MEANTQRRGAGLREKLPELNRSLDTVRFLRTRKVSRGEEAHNTKTKTNNNL